MKSEVISININQVHVNGRHRKDLGDIESLARSIEEIGLLHPIVVKFDNRLGWEPGKPELIAGARRLEAFQLLHSAKGGKEYLHIPATIAESLDDALALLRAERDENTCRKDFAPSEAVAIGRTLEEIEKPAAKERMLNGRPSGKLPEGKKGDTRDKVGKAVGMSGKNYEKAKAIVYASETMGLPELVEIMDTKSVEAAHNELKRKVEQDKRKIEIVEINSSIFVGDMREVGAQIADNSIDLILTDPPYPGEFLPLFSELSQLAERVLKPGGLCLVYSGQIHLPEVYNRLGECLDYFWTFAIRHTGGAQRMFAAGVNTAWKPVLGYVKPPKSIFWDSFIDVTSGGREKDLHDWQQAESEAAYFIEHLSLPNSVVLDPFCGSGTVLSAAKKLGRQYLGIEISKEDAERASGRLNDTGRKV